MGWVRYGGLALRMVQSGDWVVPREGSAIYLAKPPLIVWMIAWVTPAAGNVPVWTLHLPVALSFVATLTATGLFARRWFGRWEPALVAVALLATSWEFTTLARSRRLDPLFAACLTCSLVCTWQLLEARGLSSGRRLLLVLANAFWLALATLAKGPLGPAYVAGIAALHALWTRRGRRFRPLPWLAGATLFALLVLPWPVLLVARLGWEESVAQLTRTDFTTRTGPWWTYLVGLPLRLGPWLLMLPALLAWLARERAWRASRTLRFLLLWLVVMWAPLQLSETRHHRYLLPLFPALALLMTALWYEEGTGRLRALGGWPARLRVAAPVAVFVAILAVGVASPLVAAFVPQVREEGWGGAVLVLGLGCLAAGGGALWRLRRSGDLAAALRAACLLALLGFAVYDGVRAAWFARHTQLPEIRAALEPFRAGAPAVFRSTRHGLTSRHDIYLITGRWIESVRDPDAVADWLAEAGEGALLVTDEPIARRLAEDPRIELGPSTPVPTMRHPLQLAPARLKLPAGRPPRD